MSICKDYKHDILLMIPGPSTPYPEVLKAACENFLPHYGDIWLDVYNNVLNKIKKIFGTKDEVYLYPGQATSVMEMAINSIVEKDDYVVLINRGFFVDRFRRIVEIYGGKTINIGPERLGHRISVEELDYLLKNIKPKAVILVHSETSTGVLEDIDNISSVIPDETFFIIDAVSIFGAIEYKCDEWGADFCVGYSSKALSALPGITPFMVSKRLIDYISSREYFKGFINDFKVWLEFNKKWKEHPYPVSLPTQNIIALDTAINKVLDEGIKNVEKRHYRISRLAREYINSMKFKMIPDEEVETPTVSVFLLPDKLNSNDITRKLLENSNIMISTTWLIGLNGLRIGHMGYTANEKFIETTFSELEKILEGIER